MTLRDMITCFFSELIGTGLLVLFGCMGCIRMEGIPNPDFQIAAGFGIIIMTIVESFAIVSGSFINPAVTIAAFIYKKVTLLIAGMYIIAQVIGALVGFGLLKLAVPAEAIRGENATTGLCTTIPRSDISVFQALGIECLITMVLILVCCAIWDPRNAKNTETISIKFGLTIAILASFAGPWTGASMNPARSLAPAIWNGDFEAHWIYWVGPILSATVTSLTYRIFFRRDLNQEEIPLAKNNA